MPITADTILKKKDKQPINGNCLDQCAISLGKIRAMGNLFWHGSTSTEDPVMADYSQDDVQAMADIILDETLTLERMHTTAEIFVRRLRAFIHFLIPRVPDIDQVIKEYVNDLLEKDPEALQDETIRHILNTAPEASNDRSKKREIQQPS